MTGREVGTEGEGTQGPPTSQVPYIRPYTAILPYIQPYTAISGHLGQYPAIWVSIRPSGSGHLGPAPGIWSGTWHLVRHLASGSMYPGTGQHVPWHRAACTLAIEPWSLI